MFAPVRKLLILTHRYLGIVLSLLFLTWFISGIAMIYARGMPTLSPAAHLEQMPVLNSAAIRLTPAQALDKLGFGSPGSAELLMMLNRPAYRFDGVTVFADNGEILDVTPEVAAESARLFMKLPEDQLRPVETLTAVDQWTIGNGQHLPLYKFEANDGDGTEIYVSGVLGEVVVLTTQSSRRLAWVAAIPH